MTNDRPTDPQTVAIEQLVDSGLGVYAARTFVALVALGSGTAKDVSGVVDVPRTRVYDAVEELGGQGLVDVQQRNPKVFHAVSGETAVRKFEREFDDRVARLATALDEIEPVHSRDEQRGVWTVTGQQAVTDRVLEFIASADEEVVYMTVGPLLDDEIVEALRDAADRDVAIRLAGLSPDVQDRIEDAVPDAETFETLWTWSDTPAGRTLLVDGVEALASVLVDDGATRDPPTREETAIWGAGETNSLVVILKAIFTWQLREGTD